MKFKILEINLLCLLIFSCTDKKEAWLKQYGQIKCGYFSEMEKIKNDSIMQIPGLYEIGDSLRKELEDFSNPYNSKISDLKDAQSKTNKEYMKDYRKLTDEHNAKFGHISTPGYEKALANLKLKKQNELDKIHSKIIDIQNTMTGHTEYINLKKEIETTSEKIKTCYETILSRHKVVLDSLKEVLNTENANYKSIYRRLRPDEQKIFESKRDSIRANPC